MVIFMCNQFGGKFTDAASIRKATSMGYVPAEMAKLEGLDSRGARRPRRARGASDSVL